MSAYVAAEMGLAGLTEVLPLKVAPWDSRKRGQPER